LYLTIRIQDDLPGLGVHKTDGQLGPQLAARRFAQGATVQACLEGK
jgi:hypothetical protein